MTSGWGSFLVAGHERLSNLKDMNSIVLRDQLHGNDSASFTAQLAGLGLLLSTSEDSWDISSGDALQWEWLNTHQPFIIVGNPPFSGSREKASQTRPSSAEKVREEKANRFLEHAINRLAPHGYLAMLMPSSFIAAEASPNIVSNSSNIVMSLNYGTYHQGFLMRRCEQLLYLRKRREII